MITGIPGGFNQTECICCGSRSGSCQDCTSPIGAGVMLMAGGWDGDCRLLTGTFHLIDLGGCRWGYSASTSTYTLSWMLYWQDKRWNVEAYLVTHDPPASRSYQATYGLREPCNPFQTAWNFTPRFGECEGVGNAVIVRSCFSCTPAIPSSLKITASGWGGDCAPLNGDFTMTQGSGCAWSYLNTTGHTTMFWSLYWIDGFWYVHAELNDGRSLYVIYTAQHFGDNCQPQHLYIAFTASGVACATAGSAIVSNL